MKNIHILPTDKPSRLYLHSENELQLRTNIIRTSEDYLGSNQHIYITSNEEIKEGDWTLMFDSFGHLFLCHKPQQYLGIEKGHHLNKGLRKIILTTDPDLIKDGIQAIDDTFLEWFVNNPSCEEVEIERGYRGYNLVNYKIIIPKEESKQERMYSEEEVLEIIRQYALEEHLITGSKPDIWFKQYKKK